MTNEDKKEVLREHFEECLKHFGEWFNAKSPRGMRHRAETMVPMARFLGASQQTVQRWLDGIGALPTGEYRIKLTCYLDLHGYKVIEFERMGSNSKTLRNFTELIGYGILTAQQACDLSGSHETQHLYRIITEKCGLSKDKEDLMWRVWKERREELEAKKKEAWEKHRLKVLFKPSPKTRVAETPLLLASKVPESDMGARRNAAVLHILENSLALLDDGFLESLSEGDLAIFAQPILQLSSRLSDLSSKVLANKGGK